MRSLADDLRSRTDEQLAALVAARPDLLHPVPTDITALAQRAGSPASVAACLRGYDQFALHVVLAAAMGPDPVRPTALAVRGGWGPSRRPDGHRPGARLVVRMRSEALLWGPDRSLHLVGPARDLMVPAERGPRVAALDPSWPGTPGIRSRCGRCWPSPRPAATAALGAAAAGPVIGTVADARPPARPDRSPVDWSWPTTSWCPSVGTGRSLPPRSSDPAPRPGPADPGTRTVIDLAAPAPAPPPLPTRHARVSWALSGPCSTSCTGPGTGRARPGAPSR